MKNIKFCFENKNFVVVGASSGMGRQISLDLVEAGANVLAVARNIPKLKTLKDIAPNQITVSQVDVVVANDAKWDDVLSSFVNIHGKCHGAVYTAGVTAMTPLRSYDDTDVNRIFDTSLFGMVRFMHMISKKKYTEKGSSYLAFSSTAAHLGNKGQFAYTAAKGGVQAAVRSLAKDICRDSHRINSISPGWVESEMTCGHKDGFGAYIPEEIFERYLLGTGKPEDVSGMVLFLLSDAARWITGTDIVIDGGSLLGTH